MSRNMRHRFTPPPAQKMPSSSSHKTQESDSDDDYGGVDDISGSDEDEPDVEVAEERAIISSEGEELLETPRPNLDEEYEQWDGFAFEPQAILEEPFFEQQMPRSSSVEESEDDADVEDTPVTRHVRFASPQESESETIGDSDGAEWFPDIFMDKNDLDPHFLRQIEQDDVNGQFSDDGFFYGEDIESDEAGEGIEDDSSDDESSGSSDYDSDDEGDTTDEDEVPARYIPPKRSVLRAISEVSTSEEEITRRPINRRPVLASWTHDSDTPYAMADMNSTKVKVFNMKQFRRYKMNAATPMPTPQRDFIQSSPMISNSGNIMMSAMLSDPFDDSISGQAVGPSEAFYPWTYVGADGTYAQDSSSVAASDCDDEDLWNIDDLLNFGAQSSGDEREAEPSDDSPTGMEDTPAAPSPTPARPTTARSEDQVHPLLDHFSSGTVGAFRFNQNRHQLLNRTSVTRESLAFGNAHMEGTIRGVKAGRLQHANTPITPVRKQKRPIPFESSPASPSASYAQMNKKRKYNRDENLVGHKRSRSQI